MADSGAQVREHEGLLLYSDSAVRDRRIIAGVMVVLTQPEETGGGPELQYRSYGLLSGAAEAIAHYMLSVPGMKSAVDGVYDMFQTRYNGPGRLG